MAEIKTQKVNNIILSLTEKEAQHLNGLLCYANSPRNFVLQELEHSLAEVLSDSTEPMPAFVQDGSYYVVGGEG